jgi:hypothetical protein
VLSAISQAWKSWRSAPGIALLAVVAFAVGIGSATAIFTVINGVMLRPLPYPDGERFVAVYSARTNVPDTFGSITLPDLQIFAQEATTFDAFGWFSTGRYHLTAPGEPAFVPARPSSRHSRRTSVRHSSASGSPTRTVPSFRTVCGGASAPGARSSALPSRSTIAASPSPASCRPCFDSPLPARR